MKGCQHDCPCHCPPKPTRMDEYRSLVTRLKNWNVARPKGRAYQRLEANARAIAVLFRRSLEADLHSFPKLTQWDREYNLLDPNVSIPDQPPYPWRGA